MSKAPRRSATAQAASAQHDAVARQDVSVRADKLFVWDSTAPPGAVRIHEVIIARNKKTGKVATKSYSLSSDTPCGMAPEHALQFLRDEAFIVSASDDIDLRDQQRIRPVKARVGNVNIIALSENETIAEWNELTDDALVRRAMAFPSGDKPDVNASRDELVEFLTNASKIRKADGDRLEDDGELEGMSTEEIASRFGADRRSGIDKDLPGTRTEVRPAKPQAN